MGRKSALYAPLQPGTKRWYKESRAGYHQRMPKDVAKRPYLQQPKDRSSWIFRVSVPQRLRPFLGGLREFKRVLGPTYAEALERYPAIAHEWATLHAQLKERADSEETGLASNYVPPATYKVFTAREKKLLEHFIETWEYRSLSAHNEDVKDLSDEELAEHEQLLQQRLSDLKSALRRLEPPAWFVKEMEEQLEVVLAMRLHDDFPDRRDIFLRLMNMELQALNKNLDMLAGKAFHAVPERLPEPVIAEPTHAPGKTMLDAYEKWNNQRTRGGDGKTEAEYRAYAENFCVFALQRSMATATVKALAAQPGIAESWLVHLAKSRGIKRPTLKKRRSALSTLFGIAKTAGWIDHNPFSVRLDHLELKGTIADVRQGNKETRTPFTPPVLAAYFSGPLYDGPGFDYRLPAPVAYWFPLLLRFLGARPLELAFLTRDDVAFHEDAWFIYIFSSVKGPGDVVRPTKTGVSYRRIPVPAKLIALGFIDYIQSVPDGQWLFPMHVPRDNPTSRSVYALNALGDYLRTTLEVKDPLQVTYSFRHSVIDEARSAAVPQEARDALLGHQEGDHRQKNAGELFYGARWYPAEPLKQAMAQLEKRISLPKGFPTWAKFLKQTPNFVGVVRAKKASPPRRPRVAY